MYSNKIRKYEFCPIGSSHNILFRSFAAHIALLGPSGPFHVCHIVHVASTWSICVSHICLGIFFVYTQLFVYMQHLNTYPDFPNNFLFGVSLVLYKDNKATQSDDEFIHSVPTAESGDSTGTIQDIGVEGAERYLTFDIVRKMNKIFKEAAITCVLSNGQRSLVKPDVRRREHHCYCSYIKPKSQYRP